MESNTNNTAPVQNDEISLKELFLKIGEWYRYLLTKWKGILLISILGAFMGVAYAYFNKPVYTATCTFVLDEGKSGGALSQYAGLAAMAGINLGGASDGLFQGDNIIELYKSRTMLLKTLLSYGRFDGKKELLISRYIKINKLRERWEKSKNSELKHLSFNIPVEKYTRLNDSVMSSIVGEINKAYLSVSKPDKKLSIIKVDVKSVDEQFAKVFNEAVVANVNQFYFETKTKKSTSNLDILQHQADSVRAVLNSSLGGAASAIDANPNPNLALRVLGVPSQRKQIDIQANTAIYAEIVKNLEMARLTGRQEAPLIQIIDQPVFPLQMVKFSKLKGLVFGIFFSLTVCIIYWSIVFILRDLKIYDQ